MVGQAQRMGRGVLGVSKMWTDWSKFHEHNPQVLKYIVEETKSAIAGFRDNFVILDPQTPEDEPHFSLQVYDLGDIEMLVASSLVDDRRSITVRPDGLNKKFYPINRKG